MNFNDLQESVFRFMGYQTSEQRYDYIRQQIKDDINHTLDAIVHSMPFAWWMVRETTLPLVSGTSVYTLDDWVVRPLAFWTEDTSAHPVRFRDPSEMDSSGARNESASYVSRYPIMAWYPPTTSATLTGTDGAVTEGASTVTKTGGTAWSTAHTDKMIRIQGEDADLKISAPTANSLTIDRAYRARISGNGVTGVGSSLSSVKWEISPPGRYRVVVRPTPTESQTLYYRYLKQHQRLLNTDEVPELPTEYHHVLLAGTLMRNTMFTEKNPAHSMYMQHYYQGLERLKAEDRISVGECGQLQYASPIHRNPGIGYMPNDAQSRYGA